MDLLLLQDGDWSTIFHLIMFPLILNRWFWLKDAFNIIENGQRLRGGNELPLAAGLMLITIVLYAGFAFPVQKDW
ncbi:hypothetical protein HS125_00190 [bacterium]|nr:hypothetical protein [bacterium]